MGDIGFLNNPLYAAEIASRLAIGETQTAIAAALGCSQPTISVLASKPTVKDLITKAYNRLINRTLDKSVDHVDYLVTNYRTLDPESKEKDHSFRSITKILEGAGIYPSNTMSPQTINIYQDNRVQLSQTINNIVQAIKGDFPADPAMIEGQFVGDADMIDINNNTQSGN